MSETSGEFVGTVVGWTIHGPYRATVQVQIERVDGELPPRQGSEIRGLWFDDRGEDRGWTAEYRRHVGAAVASLSAALDIGRPAARPFNVEEKP